MGEFSPSSTQRRVVEDYYRTTSAAGTASDTGGFLSATAGLRRRLGCWLDVEDKDVIDLGSGTGELCWLLREGGARSVLAVNLSREEIDLARSRTEGVEYVRQDIGDFLAGHTTASADRIYALNILEHLDKDCLSHVLEQAQRCLRPGGSLIAMVPNATSPFGGMTRYWDITHQNAFTPSSVQQLARLTGFSGVKFRECGPVPYGLVSTIRYGLWQCIRFAIWSYFMVELASGKGDIYTADMLFRLEKPTGA